MDEIPSIPTFNYFQLKIFRTQAKRGGDGSGTQFILSIFLFSSFNSRHQYSVDKGISVTFLTDISIVSIYSLIYLRWWSFLQSDTDYSEDINDKFKIINRKWRVIWNLHTGQRRKMNTLAGKTD